MIITMRHVRKAKMCSHGGRVFCKKHNISWPDFLRQGIEVSALSDVDDVIVKKVIAIVIKENAN